MIYPRKGVLGGYRSFSNDTLHAKGLTPAEYGVLIRLLSNKSDWDINAISLTTMFEMTLYEAKKVLKGLTDKGYLQKKVVRDKTTGQVRGTTYDLYEIPFSYSNKL